MDQTDVRGAGGSWPQVLGCRGGGLGGLHKMAVAVGVTLVAATMWVRELAAREAPWEKLDN